MGSGGSVSSCQPEVVILSVSTADVSAGMPSVFQADSSVHKKFGIKSDFNPTNCML